MRRCQDELRTPFKKLSLCLTIALFWTTATAAIRRPKQQARSGRAPIREIDWATYLDKVQGEWMGKMMGVTFGEPWELQIG